jgi:hypothetical protein
MSELKMSEVERNVRASAVMEFANVVAGAYVAGFIDNHPTVYDIYRSAQNHVKDHYQVDTDVWNDEHAKESRSDTYEKLQEENQRLTAIATKHETRSDELYEFVEKVANAKVCNQEISGQFGGVEEISYISDIFADRAKELIEKSRIEAEKGDGICN